MHAASAPSAFGVLCARARVARGRSPVRYRRRSAVARANNLIVLSEGRDADAVSASSLPNLGDNRDDVRPANSVTRHSHTTIKATAFVAVATAVTLALASYAPPPPMSNFFRAEAAEVTVNEQATDAALTVERKRDRRAAERVVDAFLALSRDDQVQVVDRLVFAGDADRRSAVAAASTSETASLKNEASQAEKGSPAKEETGEDPFAEQDARDGWDNADENAWNPFTVAESNDAGDENESLLSEKADKSDDPLDSDDGDDGNNSPITRLGQNAVSAAATAAATAVLRFSETAPELFAKVFDTFRNGDFDLDVRYGFVGLVVLALLPEIRNAVQDRDVDGEDPIGGDDAVAGHGDEVTGDVPNSSALVTETKNKRTKKTTVGPAIPGTSGVLWQRRDDAGEYDDLVALQTQSGGESSTGVLWVRAEGDDEKMRRRKEKRSRSRRAGGRNGLSDGSGSRSAPEDNESLTRDQTVPPLGPSLGPVEDENMENVRFTRK